MLYMETAIIALIIVLTGYITHRSLSTKIEDGLKELDARLALAITQLVENLPLDMEGPNPFQVMIMELVKSKISLEPKSYPDQATDGKFISNNQ